MTSAPVVLYDVDCGLCRWTVAKLLSWDRRRILRFVSLQDRAQSDPLLGDMSEETRMASWHLALPDGRVLSGGAALPALFELLPRGKPLSRVTAAAQPLTSAAYRLVARRRSVFGRLLSTGARRRADARLHARGLPT